MIPHIHYQLSSRFTHYLIYPTCFEINHFNVNFELTHRKCETDTPVLHDQHMLLAIFSDACAPAAITHVRRPGHSGVDEITELRQAFHAAVVCHVAERQISYAGSQHIQGTHDNQPCVQEASARPVSNSS